MDLSHLQEKVKIRSTCLLAPVPTEGGAGRRTSKYVLMVIRISDYQVVGIRISGHQAKKFFFAFPDVLISQYPASRFPGALIY